MKVIPARVDLGAGTIASGLQDHCLVIIQFPMVPTIPFSTLSVRHNYYTHASFYTV